MNVLGFDTSTAAIAACVARGDGQVHEAVPDVAALTGPPRHAEELLPVSARLLEAAGLAWADLDLIAVGRGPGTFTGLRIGIATARALAQALDRPLRAVSSLAVLAAGAGPRLCLPLIDARRGEVFAALHEDGEERWEPWAAPPEAVAARLAEAGVAPLAVGGGSLRFRTVLEAAGVEVAPDGSPLHLVRAAHLCRLAVEGDPTPREAVVPEYLRDPDARPAR